MACCGGSSDPKSKNKKYREELKVANPFSYNEPSLKKAASQMTEAKVVLLGDSGVGKSSIAQRFVRGIFSESHDVTIGGAYLQQVVTLGG